MTINPVRHDLLARSDNRLGRCRHTTRDVDVAVLRWLFLDIDPVRPPDISSTEAELAAALARRDAILGGEPAWPIRHSGAVRATGPGSWSACPTIPTIRPTAPSLPRPSGRSPASTATRWCRLTRQP